MHWYTWKRCCPGTKLHERTAAMVVSTNGNSRPRGARVNGALVFERNRIEGINKKKGMARKPHHLNCCVSMGVSLTRTGIKFGGYKPSGVRRLLNKFEHERGACNRGCSLGKNVPLIITRYKLKAIQNRARIRVTAPRQPELCANCVGPYFVDDVMFMRMSSKWIVDHASQKEATHRQRYVSSRRP